MTAIENELSLSAMAARRSDFARASVAAPALERAEIQASLDDRSVLLQYALGSPEELSLGRDAGFVAGSSSSPIARR